MTQQIQARTAARVHPGQRRTDAVAVAGVFQRLPRRLQEQALLRIDTFGLARRVVEEPGVEAIDVAQLDAFFHVARLGQRGLGHAALAQGLVR